MKIKDILKKQGEYYKNLASNKTVQESSETIKPKLVLYMGRWISKREYKAMTELEELIGKEPCFVEGQRKGFFGYFLGDFEVFIKNNQITYLRIAHTRLKEIPESINNLTNLKTLDIFRNLSIKEIKNLDNLTNLKKLILFDNNITEVTGLGNLQNLKKLYLDKNQISKEKNKEEIKKLKKRKIKIKWVNIYDYYPF